MRKTTRISLALGTSAALLCLSALPASAVEGEPTDPAPLPANATASVTVEGGFLTIAVPESPEAVSLSPGEEVTLDGIAVDVTDNRAVIGAWTVAATLTDFSTGGDADSSKDIPSNLVSYTSTAPGSTGASQPSLETRGGKFISGPTVEGEATTSTVTAVTATGVSGNNAANWVASLTLPVPADALAGTYTATLTHSFI